MGSYSTISTLPDSRKRDHRRYIFCGTFHRGSLTISPSSLFTRHATLRCPDFPQPALRHTAITRETARKRYGALTRVARFILGRSQIFRQGMTGEKVEMIFTAKTRSSQSFEEVVFRGKLGSLPIHQSLAPNCAIFRKPFVRETQRRGTWRLRVDDRGC